MKWYMDPLGFRKKKIEKKRKKTHKNKKHNKKNDVYKKLVKEYF